MSSYNVHNFSTGDVLNASDLNEIDAQIKDDADDIELLTNKNYGYSVEGSFANMIYETLGLYVDENGDIAQREV